MAARWSRSATCRDWRNTDPGLALALAVFMFSLAGIPPMSGFFAKLYIFLAAVQGGLWTLAVIGVLTSVVGAFYYIRIVKVMYFDAPVAAFDPRPASLSFVAAATGLFTAFFFLFPGPIRGGGAGRGEGAVLMTNPAVSRRVLLCHGRRRPATHDLRCGARQRRGWPACAGHDTGDARHDTGRNGARYPCSSS